MLTPDSTLQILLGHLTSDPLMILMALASVLVVAIALWRLLALIPAWFMIRRADARVLEAARKGNIEEALRQCGSLASPLREVFVSGLERALGRVKGDPTMAMAREQKRAMGRLRSYTWVLGTAGALMPFVGLLGTVLGVMDSFRAIGDSGQGGFAVVSAGISQALIATALGLFVALEAVVAFNLLQNITARTARDLALLVDELNELLYIRRRDDGGSTAG